MDLNFLQNNTGRKADYMITCLEIGLENSIDFILFQEPYIRNSYTISHPAYNIILPENCIRPRVAIFHAKKSKFNFELIYNSNDLQIINIIINNKIIQLINIYNEKELEKENPEYTIERELLKLKPEKNCILAGDFNAHHSWWNKNINNPIRAKNLIKWLKKFNFELLNKPDVSTHHRKNTNESIIDLVFYSKLNKNALLWEIYPEIASGSDHEILFYSYKNISDMVLNPKIDLAYNFEKADWKAFSENIIKLDQQHKILDLESEYDLEREAQTLQNIIKNAADLSIPKRLICSKSKAWWNNNLTILRKDFGKARKTWKNDINNEELYTLFIRKRNIYFQEIKNAKTQLWNKFLENAEGKEVFKAFAYTKERFITRLPTLYYEKNNIIKSASSFPQKCEAFFTTLFKEPPVSEEIDLDIPYIEKYKWPEVKDYEIENAISQSSKNKAPGPDKISFIIIQYAYKNIKNRFNIIYKALIKKGYHPICWKKATGIILKKNNNEERNRDYSIPKSYRIISLLNCLGKISERIQAKRLAFIVENPNSNLLYFDQIGGRTNKSAIDTVLSLINDIQIEKENKNITSVLFLDIKGAFDHISKNQLIKICIKLGLPKCLVYWVISFLSKREIQLSFDNDKSQSTPVTIGTPQGSPFSPILFLIYISILFKFKNEFEDNIQDIEIKIYLEKARFPSYIDDIGIKISSKKIEENCKILEKIAKYLVQKGEQNNIQFDKEKMDLIHFPLIRKIDLENKDFWVKFNGIEIKPKLDIKWLGITIDYKLNFKKHVKNQVLKATRVFHQIERLSNTERGLSFQAMRQLYMACITSIADYGVPIWWKNQLNLLHKFQILQNLALRKILGVFKTSPYKVMELEAALPPPEIRFNKICRAYILRTLQFEKSHIIKNRLPKDFILNPGDKEKPNLKYYYNWNDLRTPRTIRTRNIDEDPDPEYRPKKIKRKYKSQIDFLTSLFFFSEWPQFIKSEYKYKDKDINKLISIIIPDETKEIAAKNHINMIQEWGKGNIMNTQIILYSDGSKLNENNGIGIYDLISKKSYAYNIGKEQEIFDSEFYGIYKALELAQRQINPFIFDIWIFSDSQSILKGLKSSKKTKDHFIYAEIYKIAKIIKKQNINIYIQWSPGHMNIFGNEKADKIAKYAAEKLEPNNIGISMSFIKRKLKEKSILEWKLDWQKSKERNRKESLYEKYNKIDFKWKANLLKVNKLLWSSIQQLKIGHGYFLSYLKRFNQQYESDICNKCQMQQKQTPYHLILECSRYNNTRKLVFGKLERDKRNLYFLYSKPGIPFLIKYLKETKIATRKWILLEE